MVCVTDLSSEERAWLKERAAAGDEAAAERIRMVNEYRNERNRVYKQRRKTRSRTDRGTAVAKWQEALEQSTKQFQADTIEDDAPTFDAKASPNVTSTREYRSMLRSKTPHAVGSSLSMALPSDSDSDEHDESNASPHSQSYTPETSSSAKSGDAVITEAEINLKLEIVARKKVRAVLNKELVEIEKEMLDNGDEEAKLKLELLRVQSGAMKSE